MPRLVPVVEDLRSKLCFICLEEEFADDPSTPSAKWIHACKCTLIAHKECFDEFYKSRQDLGYYPSCPQCKAMYEVEGNWSLVARLSDLSRWVVSVSNMTGFAVYASMLIAPLAGGLFVINTLNGLYVYRTHFGKEMFDMFVTYQPSNWTWGLLLNLPLLSSADLSASALPSVFYHQHLPPLSVRSRLAEEAPFIGYSPHHRAFHGFVPPRSWPLSLPGCIMLSACTAFLYRRAHTKVTNWVLGFPLTQERGMWDVGLGLPLLQVPLAFIREQALPTDSLATAANALMTRLTMPIATMAMGSLLKFLASYSPALHSFLAIGPSARELGLPGMYLMGLFGRPSPHDEAYWERYSEWIWEEADPVWFRNAIAYGLVVLLRDGYNLFHKWLIYRRFYIKNKSRPQAMNLAYLGRLNTMPGGLDMQ